MVRFSFFRRFKPFFKKITLKTSLNCLKFSAIPTLSGYLDSNQGPPAPKAGALTGLRYTPKALKHPCEC